MGEAIHLKYGIHVDCDPYLTVVRGHSRSLKIALFDRAQTSFY